MGLGRPKGVSGSREMVLEPSKSTFRESGNSFGALQKHFPESGNRFGGLQEAFPRPEVGLGGLQKGIWIFNL